MGSGNRFRLRILFIVAGSLVLLVHTAFAGTVTIASPRPGSSTSATVPISASANETVPFHIEIWDNGRKLGDFFSSSVNAAPVLAQGAHIMTVLAVSNNGVVLDRSSVTYNVADQAASNTVTITSPTSGSTSISAVTIAASSNVSVPFHLEVWDNGYKLGNVFAGNVNGVYVLPTGSHVLTVEAIGTSGSVLSDSSVHYTVAETCSQSSTAQCNLDQVPVNNVQGDCNPVPQLAWVANGCGGGIQGVNPTNPSSTLLEAKTETGTLPDQGNLTLNGHSLHVAETQGTAHPSNVLFRGQSPTSTGKSIDTHWTLDQYVYLPNPQAHQAFEIDAQYTGGGVWTKFYTECAFNAKNGTGFWAVYDSSTGGWIWLNGVPQGGQTPPAVPCNRSQFAQPWAGSSNPAFTGWHHIAWSFLRNPNGSVTFQSLVFDSTTTQINFTPNSPSGGNVNDQGNFSALLQLDGAVNTSGLYNVVDAYVSEVNLIHTP